MRRFIPATEAQKDYIRDLSKGTSNESAFAYMTKAAASSMIEFLKKNPPTPEPESYAHSFFMSQKDHGASREVALERAVFGIMGDEKRNIEKAINDIYGVEK